MSSLNQLTLMGNVTRDIEVRFTPGGMAVGSFGLAMNRKWKDSKTNQQREEVTFVDVQVWGKTCEFVQKYFPKGSPILVCGRLKTEKWVDKATQKNRQKLIAVADQICFCGETKKQGQPGQAAQTAGGAQVVNDPNDAGADDGPPVEEIQEENIPF